MDLIIYAHPDNSRSHNAKVLQYVKGKLPDAQLIDLYSDNFDSVLGKGEWEIAARITESAGQDAKILEYREKISSADRILFIFPIWWYGAPAMLKGFFDRVFSAGFAFNMKKIPDIPKVLMPIAEFIFRRQSLYPLLAKAVPVEKKLSGKSAVVINTFGGNSLGYELLGHAPKWSIDRAILETCGISPVKRVHWHQCFGIGQEIPDEVRKKIDRALGI